MELWDLKNPAQKHLAWEIQTAVKLPSCSKITDSSPGRQITMCNCTSHLCLSCSPGPPIKMASVWTSHLTWRTSLWCVSSWSAQPWGTLLPLDPGLPVLCQTPSRRQGTTDPGEPWEQRSPGGVICNSECSGQLPRLCSGFRCSLESSHYITKRSTTKH